jgi:hypothetical protein
MATKAAEGKKSTAQKSAKSKPAKKEPKKDLAKTYNEFKEFEGKKYTGMKVGRGHNGNYDAGVWTEKKVTPEEWEINYAVTKRRAGKAPEGSGVPVGTEYHWYILAHQNVRKLDANSYSTALTGLKVKLAHKRAGSDKWNITEKTQRKKLIKVLQDMIAELEKEPEIIEEPEKEPEPQPVSRAQKKAMVHG